MASLWSGGLPPPACVLRACAAPRARRLATATQRRGRLIYAALGVIYAVLLALVVIAVWEEYGAARETVEQEANAAADIFWLANQLPQPRGTNIQELVRSYAEEVVHREWPLMEQGKVPLMTQERGTPAGWTIIDDIRQNIQGFEPRTKGKDKFTAEGSTRSIPWLMQGGCVWWRQRKVFPVSCGQSSCSGGLLQWASPTCLVWRTRGRTGLWW